MPLWLPEAAARIHPLAVDRMLVAAGIEPSLTKARRAITDGSVYLNNERLVPPGPGFLPVVYAPQYPDLYGWIWDALREEVTSSDREVEGDALPVRPSCPHRA